MVAINFLRTVRLDESRAYAAGQTYDLDGEFAMKMVDSGTAKLVNEPVLTPRATVKTFFVDELKQEEALSEVEPDTADTSAPKRGRPRKGE